MTPLKTLLTLFHNGELELKNKLLEIADGNLCFFKDGLASFPESHLTTLFDNTEEQESLRRESLFSRMIGLHEDRDYFLKGGSLSEISFREKVTFLLGLGDYYKSLSAELIVDIVDFRDLRLIKNPDTSGYFDPQFFLTFEQRTLEDQLVVAGEFEFGGRRLISHGHFYDLHEYFIEDAEATSWRDWKLWERNDDPSQDAYQIIESLPDVPQVMMKPVPEPRQFGSWKGGTWTATPPNQQLAFIENLVAVHEESIFSGHEDLVSLIGLLYLHPGTNPDARRLIGEAMAPLFDDFPIPT